MHAIAIAGMVKGVWQEGKRGCHGEPAVHPSNLGARPDEAVARARQAATTMSSWPSRCRFRGLAVLSVGRRVPTFGNAYKFDARFHLLQFPVFSGAGLTAPGPTCQGPPDLGPVWPLFPTS